MRLTILYFASLRERLGCSREQLDLPEGVADVAALSHLLAMRGGEWQALRSARNLRCAVNQQMAGPDSSLASGDEVAFFPPVTGG